MHSKKTILILCDWYLPASKAGGPVKSIASLVFHLSKYFQFYIITGNKDLYAAEPHRGISSNQWNLLACGEHVFYFSDTHFSLKHLDQLMHSISFDAVYLNSFFSKRFTLYPLLLKKLHRLNKPVLLAPRGMLSRGALALKASKKSGFIKLAKVLGIYDAIQWHATSLQEEEEIKISFGKTVQVHRLANLSMPPGNLRSNYDKEAGSIRICCVARISQVKNILYAIECVASMNPGKIQFDLYGPAEETLYDAECKKFATSIRHHALIQFMGHLPSPEVEEKLKLYHAFLLPTHNENYGHAIVEAMQNGCIPVISNCTPWQHLEEKNIGWDIALEEKEKYTAALNTLLAMDPETFETKSKAVQVYATQHCMDLSLIDHYKILFEEICI